MQTEWYDFRIEEHPGDIFKTGEYVFRGRKPEEGSPWLIEPNNNPFTIFANIQTYGIEYQFRKIGNNRIHPALEGFLKMRVRNPPRPENNIHPALSCCGSYAIGTDTDTGVSVFLNPTHEQRMNLWWENTSGWIRPVGYRDGSYYFMVLGRFDGLKVEKPWFKNRRCSTCPPESTNA